MRTTIDRAGRVVVPKALRDSLGLSEGSELEIDLVDGRLLIEPRPVAKRVVRRKGGAVLAAASDIPALTTDMVRAALVEGRR